MRNCMILGLYILFFKTFTFHVDFEVTDEEWRELTTLPAYIPYNSQNDTHGKSNKN